MKLHGTFEILPSHVPKGTDLDYAGVVDQDVDLAKAIDDLTNGGSNLRGVEQVALNSQDRAAARSEISFCTRQFIWIARNKRNVTALRANVSRKHEAESSRPACDDGHLVAQRITCGANGTSGYPSAE